jgi:hypothetical protein
MANHKTLSFFKKRATRAQLKLVTKPREELRPVTKAERAAHPDRFSPKGAYLVPKSIKKVTSRTAFITKTIRQDAERGISHTKAAKLRAEGRLGYGPRGEERAIPKGVITHRLRRALASVEFAEKPATQWAARRKHRAAKRYPVTDEMRASFFEWRNRKLNGEMLDDGIWHELVDMARAMNDPMLSRNPHMKNLDPQAREPLVSDRVSDFFERLEGQSFARGEIIVMDGKKYCVSDLVLAEKRRRSKRAYREKNREVERARVAAWKDANPDKVITQKSRASNRAYHRPFIAIYAEGQDFPGQEECDKNGNVYPLHRTILWGAGGWQRLHTSTELAEGIGLPTLGKECPSYFLGAENKQPLDPFDIIECVLCLQLRCNPNIGRVLPAESLGDHQKEIVED